jgi:hypothetical protein
MRGRAIGRRNRQANATGLTNAHRNPVRGSLPAHSD